MPACVPRGLLFDIERFAIHDGPGMRTEHKMPVESQMRRLADIVPLPYHSLGEGKYPKLGRTCRLTGQSSPQPAQVEGLAERYRAVGLPARVR